MQGPAPELLKRSRDEIVRAGAGAGKTYTLTHRVMDIAESFQREHGRLPRLIVTTFTRKATQELRERLLILALDERPELAGFVNSRSQLVISTMHGIMDLFLKRFGSSIGIDPGYKVASSNEATKLARQTLRRLVLVEERAALLEMIPFNRLTGLLRKVDQVASESPAAAPFAFSDFQRLFESHARRMVDQLREAARQIRVETDRDTWVAMAEGYLSLAKILERGDWAQNRALFLGACESLPVARRSSKGAQTVTEETAKFAKAVRDQAGKLEEPLYDPEVWRLFADRYDELTQLAREFSSDFANAKLERGLIEISDLEHLAARLVREYPEAADAFAREWDHWLIDEYQDTSPFQVELIRSLSGASPGFIVGDPQQSIYLFRGARSEVFAEREQRVLAEGGERRLLDVNRRSRPELLLFMNDVFARMTPPFQPMRPFFAPGQSLDPTRQVAKIFIAGTATEAATETESGADTEAAPPENEEMLAVVRHVQDLLGQGARYEDICVLGRTNRSLIEVAEILSGHGLPTHVHVASGFFDRREIRDALALVKFLINPHDAFNLVELLRSPWFKLPDEFLCEIARRRRPSLWLELTSERSMGDEFEAVRRLEGLTRLAREVGLSEAFQQALLEAGFIDLAHEHDVSGRRESNVWKLLSRLREEEAKPGFNPLAFVAGSRDEMRLDDANSEGDAVAAVEPDRINLMTVHASKGLEFKHVVIPRMNAKPRLTNSQDFTFDENENRWAARLPHGEDHDFIASLPEALWLEKFRAQELAEHARVLYVAITRASETLFMSWTAPEAVGSWASMIKLSLDTGHHATASYTYEVVREFPAPKEWRAEKGLAVTPRPPFMALAKPEGAFGLYAGAEASQPISVTDLLDRKPGVQGEPASPREMTNLLAHAARGTAVHRLMELLKYPSQSRLARLIERWFPGQEDDVLEAINFVRGASEPPLMQVIADGHVEWRFSLIERGLLIDGQVDLWGIAPDGTAWIVDYKTGSPKMREKAFAQMAIYSLGVRRSGLLGDTPRPLKLAAVYPFSREIFSETAPSIEQVHGVLGI